MLRPSTDVPSVRYGAERSNSPIATGDGAGIVVLVVLVLVVLVVVVLVVVVLVLVGAAVVLVVLVLVGAAVVAGVVVAGVTVVSGGATVVGLVSRGGDGSPVTVVDVGDDATEAATDPPDATSSPEHPAIKVAATTTVEHTRTVRGTDTSWYQRVGRAWHPGHGCDGERARPHLLPRSQSVPVSFSMTWRIVNTVESNFSKGST